MYLCMVDVLAVLLEAICMGVAEWGGGGEGAAGRWRTRRKGLHMRKVVHVVGVV